MTFSEYRAYTPPPGFRDELIHGEVRLSPSTNRKHADLCHALSQLLRERIDDSRHVVRLDTTHRLGDREGPRPDVFVIRRDRWIAADQTGGYPEGSPELAVEVLSQSNEEAEMKTKRELYLSDPRCLEVWEVDILATSLVRHRRDSVVRFLTGEALPLPDLLGGALLSVQAISEGIVR